MIPNVVRKAAISQCGVYRYILSREYVLPKEIAATKGTLGFVLNNPSIADANLDDPTVTRCWGFAESLGYGRILIANTNPFRATDPNDAIIPPEHIMECNDTWLLALQRECQMVIVGWGIKAKKALVDRAANVLYTTGPVHALRINENGSPAHPLYLPGSLKPVRWKPRGH